MTWGPECISCGHPADYHTVTACMVNAGAAVKVRCDCSGYLHPSLVRAPEPVRGLPAVPETNERHIK